jgi:DTW domain-containing protein YfiP
MDTSANVKRLMCAACRRPQRMCICHWVMHVDNRVEVVILQHPLEAGEAKGTARLLHMCLARSELHVGEVFDIAHLARPDRQVWLLYPDTPQIGMPKPVALTVGHLQGVRLVVLDATWRKSRKMLHLNPWLLQLPRLALVDLPLSRYRIRKAHRPEQLSTFEATCAALAQLEGGAKRFEPMLQAFDGFVRQHAVPV